MMAALNSATVAPGRRIVFVAGLLAALLALAACAGAAQSASSDSQDPSSTSETAPASVSNSAASTESASETNESLAFEDIPAEAVIGVSELAELVDNGDASVIDIRQLGDYYIGHIFGSNNIPAGRQLEIRVREVPREGTVVLVAQANEQLADARQTLIDLGIEAERIKVLNGGMDAWTAADLPVEMILERGC